MAKKTPATELQDRQNKLDELFGPGARKCIDTVSSPSLAMFPGKSGLFGKVDTFALEDFLCEHHGAIEDGESLRDYITRKFSEEAADWVESNI